jgi:hypothetical protein
MREGFQDDQQTVQDGRTSLKESEDLQIKVSKRDEVMRKLVSKLEEQDVIKQIAENWHLGNADRQEWLNRQEDYLMELDEFIRPIIAPAHEWSSALHRPTILTVCKTYHARMFSALMAVDPSFTVTARQAAFAEKAPLVQELMRYVLKDYANHYKGVEEEVDKWLWSWCTRGSGLLKARWETKFTSFIDVESVPRPGPVEFQVAEDGSIQNVPTVRYEEVERERTIKCFEGPCIEHIPIQQLLIVGGNGDPQRADYVIEQRYMTASELWQLVDQGVFLEAAVKKIIEAGADHESGEPTNSYKSLANQSAGIANLDKNFDTPRYQILEAYLSVDVNGSGIGSEVQVFCHPRSKACLRASYLYRVNPSGLRPYFKIDFHKRENQDYGVGLVELLYSLGREIDAMCNLRMDIGILTSLPFGFYRPTASMAEERLSIEPGAFIPLDNPQSDIFIPNLMGRTTFGYQEEQALYQQIERLTSISDISLGIIAGQGASRTATGTRALIGEANANLDIFLRRMNRGWRSVLHYVFHLVQQKLPAGFEFRVFGSDGQEYFQRVDSREAIYGMYDFELDPNSANSSKQIQIETADFIYSLAQNPMLLQMGLISPRNLYEATKNVMQVRGIKDFSRFLTLPQNVAVIYTPEELANRALAGINTPLDPTQDLQGFLAYTQELMGNDELLGQIEESALRNLAVKMQEAQGLLQAMEQAAAQQAVAAQQSFNQQAGQGSMQMEGMGQPAAPVGTEAQ